MLQLFPFRSFSRDSRLVLLLWLAFFRQSSFSHVVLAKRIHMLIRLLNKMNKKNGSKKKYNKKNNVFPIFRALSLLRQLSKNHIWPDDRINSVHNLEVCLRLTDN